MAIIEVKNLTKIFKKPIREDGLRGMLRSLFSRKYDEVRAVDGVSFDIEKGEIVGYIGANGAGKSTTVKMMCGILHPTSGSVTVDGMGFARDRKKINRRMGVVFGQKTQLWWDIPLIETFRILKSIYEIDDVEFEERFNYLCDLLDMRPFLSQTVRSLSLGQRMRADFAAALIHSPSIVYLDEPTIGLDVLVKDKIRHAIREMNRRYNVTVILTTHDMKDIEELCNRIIIIDKGRILYDGSLADIKYRFGHTKRIFIPANTPLDREELARRFEGAMAVDVETETVITFSQDRVNVDEMLLYLIGECHARDFKIEDVSIEDVTKELYEKNEK